MSGPHYRIETDAENLLSSAPLCRACWCRDWLCDYANGDDDQAGYLCPDCYGLSDHEVEANQRAAGVFGGSR